MIKKQQRVKCNLCFPTQYTDHQLAILINNIIEKIKIILIQNCYSSQPVLNDFSFHQFIKTLLDGSNLFKMINFQCNHEELKKFIVNFFNIQEYILNNVCEYLCSTILKKRYQMQIVKNMAKNFPKTIINKPNKHKQQMLFFDHKKKRDPQNLAQIANQMNRKKNGKHKLYFHENTLSKQIKVEHLEFQGSYQKILKKQDCEYQSFNQMSNYFKNMNSQKYFNPYLFEYGCFVWNQSQQYIGLNNQGQKQTKQK